MAIELRSELLQNVDELQPIASGAQIITPGTRGAAVQAMQAGLIELGYALNGGADGIFGPSSEGGLTAFRELHDMFGAPMLNEVTLGALDESLVRRAATAGYALQNPRFAGDATLQAVLAGSQPMPGSGDALVKVQQALMDLMFSMPRWGADGHIGGETREATRRFQRWQRIRPGGEVSPLTLMALDHKAPGTGQVAERFPEYDAMVRENMLTVTLAIGYDEDDNDQAELSSVRTELQRMGFSADGTEASGGAELLTRNLEIDGRRHQTLRLRLIHRDTPNPEAEFAEGLVHDAITLYSGHARYGTGPDFDHKESADQNFVIGIGSPQHSRGQLTRGYNAHMNEILAGVPNDLIATRFDPNLKQLWGFLGCSTDNYLDELRALVEAKDTRNLDLVVSTRAIYWSDGVFFSTSLLQALIEGRSINTMLKDLNDRADATETRLGDEETGPVFIGDGFGDNGPR